MNLSMEILEQAQKTVNEVKKLIDNCDFNDKEVGFKQLYKILNGYNLISSKHDDLEFDFTKGIITGTITLNHYQNKIILYPFIEIYDPEDGSSSIVKERFPVAELYNLNKGENKSE